MSSLYDLTFAEASLFENYNSNGYDDLLIALKSADERVINRILGTKGEWTRTKLNDLKRLINEEIGNAYGGLFASMQDESVEAAQIVLGATVGNISAELPEATINDLINSKRQIQGYGFKELFDTAEANHARQLRVLLASGVTQGLTASQIAREYGIKSDKLSKGQVTTNIFTTISESRDQGRYTAYKQLEDEGIIKGYIYDATLDSSTTVYCREHDQRRYYDNIEDIQQYIKVHFNCRSVFRPIPSNEVDVATRASQFGPTKEVPYEQWYLNQTKAFQKSTLTNKRYEAFLKNKYNVNSIMDLNKKNGLDSIQKELFKFSPDL